jgi:hypothetical protein
MRTVMRRRYYSCYLLRCILCTAYGTMDQRSWPHWPPTAAPPASFARSVLSSQLPPPPRLLCPRAQNARC